MAELVEFLRKHPKLQKYLNRLAGITGFISILGPDPRVWVFNRYQHVIRVSQITLWLCDQFHQINRSEALLLALSHDLNRLPFAHNLEKHIGFDQASYIHSYFLERELLFPKRIIDTIVDLLNRNTRGALVSRLVYAADSAAGFIEDSLFMITAFEFDLELIPEPVREKLGFVWDDKVFAAQIRNLSNLFKTGKVGEFISRFNNLAISYAIRFARNNNQDEKLFVDTPQFLALRNQIKEEFLRKVIYPRNNENICQGKRLAQEVAIPFIEVLQAEQKDPIRILSDMTDENLLNASYQRGLIKSMEQYYPRI